MKATGKKVKLAIGTVTMSALLLCFASCTRNEGEGKDTTAGAVTTTDVAGTTGGTVADTASDPTANTTAADNTVGTSADTANARRFMK